MFLAHSRPFCNSWFLIELTLALFFKNTKIQKKSKNKKKIECKTRKLRDQNKIELLGDQVNKKKMTKFINYK
jgi:hypothetical protein